MSLSLYFNIRAAISIPEYRGSHTHYGTSYMADIIGIIAFAILYFKANKIADKYHEEVQQKIVD